LRGEDKVIEFLLVERRVVCGKGRGDVWEKWIL
jgi:hypothetical protein